MLHFDVAEICSDAFCRDFLHGMLTFCSSSEPAKHEDVMMSCSITACRGTCSNSKSNTRGHEVVWTGNESNTASDQIAEGGDSGIPRL